jgi:hypothetical protein
VAGAGNPALRSHSRAAQTSILMIRTPMAVNTTSNAVTRGDHQGLKRVGRMKNICPMALSPTTFQESQTRA